MYVRMYNNTTCYTSIEIDTHTHTHTNLSYKDHVRDESKTFQLELRDVGLKKHIDLSACMRGGRYTQTQHKGYDNKCSDILENR